MRKQVFISYSRQDREWLERIKRPLLSLAEPEGIVIWDDTKLDEVVGKKYDEKIQEAIGAAKVAVLLVTPEYLASEYIRQKELKPILEAAAEGELTVLWALIRECNLKGSGLEEIQA